MAINPPFGVNPMTPPLAWVAVSALSDSADLPRMGFAILSSEAGTVRLTCADGTVTDLPIAANQIIPGQFYRVHSTTTSMAATKLFYAVQTALS